MGRGSEKPKWCVKCGLPLKAKRLATKAYVLEMKQHEESGECFRRKMRARAKEEELKEATGSAQAAMDAATAPIYELLVALREDYNALKARVASRLESRRKLRPDYAERDSKPKPWVMGSPFDSIPAEAFPIQNFRDIMTKDYALGWSWEQATAQWFHWLLDQSSADAIMLMAREEIRYHAKAGPVRTTKTRFFRCFRRTVKDWDPLDESSDSFFIGFWYPLVRACKAMVHWQNWIIFELPISEQAKRHVEAIWYDDMMDPREPCLQRDSRIARVFYDVLIERKDRRRQARMDDEKEQP